MARPMVYRQDEDEDEEEEGVVREADPTGLAASAARLRAIVAGNEARMRQLRDFVQRLDELLDTASEIDGAPLAPEEKKKKSDC